MGVGSARLSLLAHPAAHSIFLDSALDSSSSPCLLPFPSLSLRSAPSPSPRRPESVAYAAPQVGPSSRDALPVPLPDGAAAT
ncbi:hypothetical protein GQ53DRAFT_750362 [Thozetella sp. PMI_491]|nr:hypothetical protein GQ53DRAFT_750362 [Thozetella sp. PMI_491]